MTCNTLCVYGMTFITVSSAVKCLLVNVTKLFTYNLFVNGYDFIVNQSIRGLHCMYLNNHSLHIPIHIMKRSFHKALKNVLNMFYTIINNSFIFKKFRADIISLND